jgi:hypothetical protein
LLERTVNLKVAEAYQTVKDLLLQKRCTILNEEPPNLLSVRQGSIWGSSPRTAKKTTNYRFSAEPTGTRITASSSLAADWKKLTLIGCAASLVVAVVCWWISADLENFLATLQPSTWSWIATSEGIANAAVASSFINLTRVLAVFLVVVVFLEAVIYIYAKRRIDVFAEETLKVLA